MVGQLVIQFVLACLPLECWIFLFFAHFSHFFNFVGWPGVNSATKKQALMPGTKEGTRVYAWSDCFCTFLTCFFSSLSAKNGKFLRMFRQKLFCTGGWTQLDAANGRLV